MRRLILISPILLLVSCQSFNQQVVDQLNSIDTDALRYYVTLSNDQYDPDAGEELASRLDALALSQQKRDKILSSQLKATGKVLRRHLKERANGGVWPEVLATEKYKNLSTLIDQAVKIEEAKK